MRRPTDFAERTGDRCWPVALVLLVVSAPNRAGAGEVERNVEALVGRIAAELMAHEFGTLDDPLLAEWVDRVGQRVAEPCPRQEFPFRFRVLDTADANAYALPGAHIFVTRGLLAHVGSDDELAAVLAHEVGHIADRDFQRIVARQLLFLGLAEAAERADQEELETPLHAVQLLNTLRHSRRQENQADQRGVEYALAAGYDPAALTAFFDLVLEGRNRPRPWYRGVLATHPDAYIRRLRCVEHARRVSAGDPAALGAVAEDLVRRYRYSAAAGTLKLRHELFPGDAEPLRASAELHLARGDAQGCLAACREALLASPADSNLLRIAAEAERLSRREPTRPPQGAAPEVAIDEVALARLGRLSRRLEADRRFNDALSWAQFYGPETGDWRWDYLAVRVQVLLLAVDRLRYRVTEVAGLAGRAPAAWGECPAPGGPVACSRPAALYNSAIRRATGAATDLQTAMRLLPTILTSLVLTGDGDPFGRMNTTRFALLHADLLVAQRCVDDALDACRASARDIALAETDRLALTLDGLARSAPPRQLALYEGLAATRFGLTPGDLTARSRSAGGLGQACRQLALDRSRAPADAPAGDLTYAQAEATRITLHVLTCEAKAETIGPAGQATGHPASRE